MKKLNSKKESNGISSQKLIRKLKVNNIAVTCRYLAAVGCTSTPRKSKVHFDQRRLLDQMIQASPSPSALTIDNKLIIKEAKITVPDFSFIETPVTALNRRNVSKDPMHKTIGKRLEAIAGGLKRCRRNSFLFGRRLSRRLQGICTPTSGESSSSPFTTPAVAKNKLKTPVVISSSASTGGGTNRSILLQRRLRKKSQKEKGSIPSIYLRGNIFGKYRTPIKVVISEFYRQKSRKQRMDNFNECRNIKILPRKDVEIDKTINGNTGKDIIFDFKNNNCASFNHKIFSGESVVIKESLPKKQKLVEDTFTFGEEQFEHLTKFDNDSEYNDIEHDNNEEFRDDQKLPAEDDFGCKQELVTSQDLEDFDHFIANYKDKIYSKKQEDYFSSPGSSEYFKNLLVETTSNAPFEVKHIQHNKIKNSSLIHQNSSFSTHSTPQSSQSQMDSQNDYDYTSLTTAKPHYLSSSNTMSHLPRTIYGGTVIYNHRLPNINTTYVRKSSIYVKHRNRKSQCQLDSSSCNDVVLITNQTITFLDIMRMWSQMDSSTRLIVSFAMLASFTTLLVLFISLYYFQR